MATDKEVRDLMNKRVEAGAEELADMMSRHLYADDASRPTAGRAYYIGYAHNETHQNIKLTWRLWFVMMWGRVRDALAVLRGRAEIG